MAHDEFRGMELPDVGQFMSMDAKPMLVYVRGMLDQEGGWDEEFITGDCEQHTCILNLPGMQ